MSADIVNDRSNDENPSPQKDLLGGQGDVVSGTSRETLRMLQQAVHNGWNIPEEWKAALPRFCMGIILDKTKGDRERLRASEILRSMSRDNLDALQILDKIERLEDGSATERIELGPIQWNPK